MLEAAHGNPGFADIEYRKKLFERTTERRAKAGTGLHLADDARNGHALGAKRLFSIRHVTDEQSGQEHVSYPHDETIEFELTLKIDALDRAEEQVTFDQHENDGDQGGEDRSTEIPSIGGKYNRKNK